MEAGKRPRVHGDAQIRYSALMSRFQFFSGVGWAGAFLLVSRGSALIAVPLVLHAVGTDIYAAWVLAGTLILSQGVVDFGIGAATVRFVAIGYAARQRRT